MPSLHRTSLARGAVAALALFAAGACRIADPADPDEILPPAPPPPLVPPPEGELDDVPLEPERGIALVPLAYLDARDAVAILEQRLAPLLDPSGRAPDGVRLRADVRPEERVNRVVISAPEAELDRLSEIVVELDAEFAPREEGQW